MKTDPFRPFVPGIPMKEQLTAGRLNALLEEIRANRLQQGRGVIFQRNKAGTAISTRGKK